MNRFINIGILLLLVLFISFRINVAYNELNRDQPADEIVPFVTPISFYGILPCTTCKGIDYTLILDHEKYIEHNIFLDDEMDPIELEGAWVFRSDTLSLYIDENLLHKSFLWEGSELILLDSLGARRAVNLSVKVD